jgi:hypothetical protein
VKLSTYLKLVPRSRKCGSIQLLPIRLHGVVLNQLSTGTTLLLPLPCYYSCYTELNPPSEAIRLSATQGFPNFVRNSKVHCGVHTIPPLVPILSQINPVHTDPSITPRSILILSSVLYLGLSIGGCRDFPTKPYMHSAWKEHLQSMYRNRIRKQATTY